MVEDKSGVSVHYIILWLLRVTASISLDFSTDNTYVVLSEIRVVPLDAVIQNGDNHTFAGVAPLPG